MRFRFVLPDVAPAGQSATVAGVAAAFVFASLFAGFAEGGVVTVVAIAECCVLLSVEIFTATVVVGAVLAVKGWLFTLADTFSAFSTVAAATAPVVDPLFTPLAATELLPPLAGELFTGVVAVVTDDDEPIEGGDDVFVALTGEILAKFVGDRCCCSGPCVFRAVCLIRGVVTVASFMDVFEGVVTVAG